MYCCVYDFFVFLCFFNFVFFLFFVLLIKKQTTNKNVTVTVAEEDEMYQQQRDLMNGYLAKYKSWNKIPKNKYNPSFKLLKVDQELGINGILRKLGIDPNPIRDDEDDMVIESENVESETGVSVFFLIFFCKKTKQHKKQKCFC